MKYSLVDTDFHILPLQVEKTYIIAFISPGVLIGISSLLQQHTPHLCYLYRRQRVQMTSLILDDVAAGGSLVKSNLTDV